MSRDKTSIINQAQRFTAKGQIDRAIQEWEKVLEISPKDGNTHNTIGDLLLRKNDSEKAITFYSKAARLFRDQGFSMKAMALYKKIVHIDARNVEGLTALGDLNAERGLVGNANENYLSAAALLVQNNTIDQAVELYEKIISLSPKSLSLHLKIADLYAKIGLEGQAARVKVRCGNGYLERADLDKAESLFRKAIEDVPSEPGGYVGLVAALRKKGQLPDALEVLDEGLARIPGHPDISMARASVLRDLGRSEEALAAIQSVLSEDPGSLSARRFLIGLRQAAGHHSEAWEELRQAFHLCLESDRYDEALEILDEGARLPDREQDILRLSAQVLREAGRVGEAVSSLKKLADAHLRSGDNDTARIVLEEAASLAPADKELKTRIEELSGPMAESLKLEDLEPGTATQEGNLDFEPSAEDYVKSLEQKLTGISGDLSDFQNVDVEREEAEEEEGSYEISADEIDFSVLKDTSPDVSGGGNADEIGTVHREPTTAPVIEADGRGSARAGRHENDDSPGAGTAGLSTFEEDLAEGDFYLEQGLKDEAYEIFQNLSRQYPERPEVAERLATLHRSGPQQPAADVRPQVGSDVTSFLESLKEESGDSQRMNQQATEEMESIFDAFKKGVEQEVEEGDFDTHYNLGIAYKEMGLLADAIREFQIAVRFQNNSVQAGSMLALCHMEDGRPEDAIPEFQRILALIRGDDDRYVAIQYDLAVALEAAGDRAGALSTFRKIAEQNPSFKNVSERIERLRN